MHNAPTSARDTQAFVNGVRERVTPVQDGFVVRDRLVPSLEELEEACFSGEWDQCNQDNLRELSEYFKN